jgi:tricorn protease
MARVGERIVAVNGQPPDRASSRRRRCWCTRPARQVELTLDGEGRAPRREVMVKPLADETPARYRAWVEQRRAWVHMHSGGQASATCTCRT